MHKKMTKTELDKFDSPFLLFPYRFPSASFRALADAMKYPIVSKRHFNYLFENREGLGEGKIIINWGSRNIPVRVKNKATRVLNSPTAVFTASNKLKFFEQMHKSNVRVPEFTDNLVMAEEWINNGSEVFGRKLTGHSGLDITLFSDNPEEFAHSDFWVKYKKKKAEFRVHIVDKKTPTILAVQQKVLRKETPEGEEIDKNDVNFRIRNHRNGFIFQRNNISPPQDVLDMSVAAFKASGLDFGAFDVIYNEREDKAYILEANTAPGLEGQTVAEYAGFFEAVVRGAA